MSRKVMKLALEALEWMVANDDTNEGDEPLDRLGGQSWNEYNSYWIDGLNNARTSITALREALAEDDSVVWGVDRAPAQQEPVAHCEAGPEFCLICHQEQPAQQEPVATVTSETGNPNVSMSWWHEPALPVGTKLYTSPQRTWVGLTDDEMQAIWDRYAHMEMMRAIEQRLKEKNT